jgi:hypothetical protein
MMKHIPVAGVMFSIVLLGSPTAIAKTQNWACLWNGAFTLYGVGNGSWVARNGTEFSDKPFGLTTANGVITPRTAVNPMRSNIGWINCEKKFDIKGLNGVYITACWDKFGGTLFMDLVSGEGGVSSLMGAMNLRGNNKTASSGDFWVGKFTCRRV